MNIPVFDAHCDTILEVKSRGVEMRRNSLHIDLERGGRFTPYAQIFAVFTRPCENGEYPTDYLQDWPAEVLTKLGGELLDKLLSEFYVNRDILVHCKSAEEARRAADEGKIAAFIAIEGAELLGCDIGALHVAYDKGVRYVNLCWNYDNALCGAANGAKKDGLSPKGAQFVAEMQRLGMAVDLSHASESTFWDVIEIAKRPVLAGHSNSKAECDNARNLTDEQFKALVKVGGVAGLNLCPAFLNESGKADIDDIVRHAEHFLALGGERALCLGGDLDGIDSMPKGMSGIEDYEKLYEALLRRNYPESLVRDIFYNNLMNFTEAVL